MIIFPELSVRFPAAVVSEHTTTAEALHAPEAYIAANRIGGGT